MYYINTKVDTQHLNHNYSTVSDLIKPLFDTINVAGVNEFATVKILHQLRSVSYEDASKMLKNGGSIKCGCRASCRTKACKCFKSNLLCSSACHSNYHITCNNRHEQPNVVNVEKEKRKR